MGHDLEIEIRQGATPGTYEVEVDSPAGPATGTMRLDAAAILDRRRELAASVLASSVTRRSTFTTLERPVRDVGHALFEALFAGRVYGRYTASLQQAGGRGEALRVVLRLRAPELAGIPWETLYDPEAGEYLCQREPVVRYVEAAQPSTPLSATGPLRILGLVAAPSDLDSLDTAEEKRRLDDALGELDDQGVVEMVWVEGGSWGALQHQLMAGPWHVLHVIGHGGVRDGGGVLALEDERTGKASMVSATRFARLLHACRPVPRLVVLNSCSSGESAADDLLSSTAAALVHSGISAAVAMQFAVTDPAALAFSRGFYQALAHNIAVDEAVRLGRIAIDGTSEQTLEWVTPVIYLRTDDARLFELTSQPRAAAASAPAHDDDIAQEAAKYGLYVQALAAARKQRYDEALALLDSLVTLDPSYRDATELRARLRREQRLDVAYADARAAEEKGDWEGARRGYRAVLDLDGEHRDALARHDACQRRLDVVSLQDELRVHAHGEDWTAVLAVSDELAGLDPRAADPEGLATRARSLVTDGTRVLPAVRDVVALSSPPEEAPEEAPEDAPEDAPEEAREQAGEEPGDHRKTWPRWASGIGVGVLALVALSVWRLSAADDGAATSSPDGGAARVSGVTCWDGASAPERADCSVPQGRAGLTSVFGSLNQTCPKFTGKLVGGKAEVYECDFDRYVIRYTRWETDVDHIAAIDRLNPDARSATWRVDGEVVGTTWTGPDPTRPGGLRWVASYRYAPFDVVVKGADADRSRRAGTCRGRGAASRPDGPDAD